MLHASHRRLCAHADERAAGRDKGAEDVQIVGVDERDSNNWEDDRPRFRVYVHGSGETST